MLGEVIQARRISIIPDKTSLRVEPFIFTATTLGQVKQREKSQHVAKFVGHFDMELV
jgi:hypothetical protein